MSHFYKLVKTTQLPIAQLVCFTKNNFAPDQPMQKHLKLNPQILMKSLQPIFYESCTSNLSFAFTHGQQIAAISLSLPYLQYAEVWEKRVQPLILPEFRPVTHMLNSAEGSYKIQQPQKVIQSFFSCTSSKHYRKGLLNKLMLQRQRQGKKQGFNQLTSICTGIASQNALLKLNFKIKNKVLYNDFEYEGNYPFRNLEGEQGVYFMTKNID